MGGAERCASSAAASHQGGKPSLPSHLSKVRPLGCMCDCASRQQLRGEYAWPGRHQAGQRARRTVAAPCEANLTRCAACILLADSSRPSECSARGPEPSRVESRFSGSDLVLPQPCSCCVPSKQRIILPGRPRAGEQGCEGTPGVCSPAAAASPCPCLFPSHLYHARPMQPCGPYP